MKCLHSYLAFMLLIFAAGCATQVPPAGGPKDTTPPVALSYNPPMGTTDFHGDKILIRFDEFIELKDLNTQMLVSPPMPHKPNLEVRGKKLLIKLPDSLADNTSYSIFLGDAIVNYKEGLAVPHFQYVFSTGKQLDSLHLQGKLREAFDLKTEPGILVMLYKDTHDSTPYLHRPYYLAKTYDDGYFEFNNIGAGQYLLFALKDLNSNYIYDQPDEEIAFADSLVVPQPVSTNDSINSLRARPVNLFLFRETEKKQTLLSAKRINSRRLLFTFRKPAGRVFVQVNGGLRLAWNYPVWNANRDSLTLWITHAPSDTLQLVVFEDGEVLDSTEIILNPVKKTRASTKGRRKKSGFKLPVAPKKKKGEKLVVRSNTQKGSVAFFNSPVLRFTTPVKKIIKERIHLYKKEDSLDIPLSFDILKDTTPASDRFVLKAILEEASHYRLLIADSALFDIFGQTNDTLDWPFSTTRMRSYGSLKLVVKSDIKAPLLIQLLDNEDRVLQQQQLSDTLVKYPYLKPGVYKIKAIADRNNNGRWDTGDYLNKRQAERVYFLSEAIKIRANWDVEKQWILETYK